MIRHNSVTALARHVVYDKVGKPLYEGAVVIAGSHRGVVQTLGPTFVRVRLTDGRVLTKRPTNCMRAA